jgi:hypothetical protein
MVQASSGIEQDPISKITKAKRVQVIKHLPSRYKALGSVILSIGKKQTIKHQYA